ncbi:MAG: hypothetical protein HONBIEJF_03017 [Fimbriimonadaceae bacterium]|nr:hypothetical protein [Fimbriimonadaceae bacterium]
MWVSRVGWLAGVVLLGAGFVHQAEVRPAGIQGAGLPLQDLNSRESMKFRDGRGTFIIPWKPDPGPTLLNASSCATCHNEPTFGGGSGDPQRLVRVTPDDADLSGFRMNQKLRYLGGDEFEFVPPLPNVEMRRSPVLYGLGLLEAVSKEALDKAIAEQAKSGITGRYLLIDGEPGRFGWKATFPTIEGFVKKAFENELGAKPFDGGTPKADSVVDMNIVRRTADYLRLLSPPKPAKRTPGYDHFLRIGCASCHSPNLQTKKSDSEALSLRSFEPYTDLLLHDMGPGEAKDGPKDRVGKREFRTPALWGLRQTQRRLWHDGSATSIEEAVEKHEGEALAARKAFRALSDTEKQALLEFLGSL